MHEGYILERRNVQPGIGVHSACAVLSKYSFSSNFFYFSSHTSVSHTFISGKKCMTINKKVK